MNQSQWARRGRFLKQRCKNATRGTAEALLYGSVFVLTISYSAHAQRAKENAVAEASDAFGTTVGREEVGLYSASSARGFSPSQAGNLRIDGLYFDQANQARPNTRMIRGSSVHVGISAQGYPFPAPTGVVDFKLRAPGDEAVAGALVGVASFDQAFGEFDFQTPVVSDVLRVGGGVGYARGSSYRIAARSWEWTAGALARWTPNDVLTITPFWSYTDHQEREERPYVFIGNSGVPPRYRATALTSQPWTTYGFAGGNYGVTARLLLGNELTVDAGMFRSESSTAVNDEPLLQNVNTLGQGTYAITQAPKRDNRANSGEVRIAKQFDTDVLHNTVYGSVKARDRMSEAGGSDTIVVGPGSLTSAPITPRLAFNLRPVAVIKADQVTPALGYEGVWRDVGQLSLGVQKTFYHRTFAVPGSPLLSSRSKPWLYNVGGAAYVSNALAVYASYTRGFEEIGNAPVNAANRDEVVPAQLTTQIDAGVRYQITPRLTFVAGVFEIEKPFFNLDAVNIFRQLGSTTNRGAEVSLAGNITDRFTVVAGATFIDPKVKYDTGAAGGQVDATAVGPIPGLIRANFQYRPSFLEGLTLDAKVERTSKRYANSANTIRLPSAITLDAGVRYNTELFSKPVTWRLQSFNLTNEYVLTPSANGQLNSLDQRRFELSLAIDF